MGGRILIAEDDYDLRAILSDFLNSCGYEALAVTNGHDALQQLAAPRRFDLLILDLSMPKVDGWAVLSQTRTRPETQSLPVIIVSAHSFVNDREKAFAAGCNGFIAKPFDPSVLLAEVQRVLNVPTGSSVTNPPL